MCAAARYPVLQHLLYYVVFEMDNLSIRSTLHTIVSKLNLSELFRTRFLNSRLKHLMWKEQWGHATTM